MINLSSILSNKAPLVFPVELRSHPERPVIQFTARATTGGLQENHSIILPITNGGLQFTDGGDYGPINLGNIGSSVSRGLRELDEGASGGDVLGTISRSAGQVSSAELANVLAKKLTPSFQEFVQFENKQIFNPHTNTRFQGNEVRSFGFAFKLIARSADESDIIRRIHTKLRHFVYAEQNNLTLSYPPVWNIKFLFNGSENEFIPKIYDCFLSNVSTTMNGSQPTFHYDGSPIEVDVTLQFTETKILTRQDIVALDNKGIRAKDKMYQQGLNYLGVGDDISVDKISGYFKEKASKFNLPGFGGSD